jgi:uncharacterized protein (TIGR02996 family)
MTETELLLLRAVRGDPEDDTLRLAYADYCDEVGDADRANFLRRHLEWQRGKETFVRDFIHASPNAVAELTVAVVRSAGVTVDWNAAVDRVVWDRLSRSLLPEGVAGDFDRGFLTAVRCTQAVFLTTAAEVFKRQPVVRKVELVDKSPFGRTPANGAWTGQRGWQRQSLMFSLWSEDARDDYIKGYAIDDRLFHLFPPSPPSALQSAFHWECPEDALAALSDAAVAFGNHLAGWTTAANTL